MNLTTPEGVRQRLQLAGVWSKKQLGQHFLLDQEVLFAMLEKANLGPDDTVVEIGPGMGVLSQLLLERAGRVVAFEFDADMVNLLKEDLPSLEVVAGDVLKTAPQVVPSLGSYKVVANIPYQITTPLIKLFLEGGLSPAPESLTLLVQDEVGERLCAAPGKPGRSYLSVLCQELAEASYVRKVPAAAFWPAPKVDSAVIHLGVRKDVPLEAERTAFLKFVRMCFLQPRKQLKNVLAGIRGLESKHILEMLQELNLKDTVRAQELTNEQWHSLYEHQERGRSGRD